MLQMQTFPKLITNREERLSFACAPPSPLMIVAVARGINVLTTGGMKKLGDCGDWGDRAVRNQLMQVADCRSVITGFPANKLRICNLHWLISNSAISQFL